jgi:predicted TIM-barrel fold metal-dependent hydrolase
MIDCPLYDADQHYYEPRDAFHRHLDPKYRHALRWVTSDDKRTHLLVGGKLFEMISNPTFNPVAKPGALVDYLKANNTSGASGKEIAGRLDPLQPEYVDRGARVKALDAHGVQTALLLPTLSLGFEELLWDTPDALNAVIHAGCQWVEEDWGLARDDRIISAPMLSLADPAAAERELRWVLERGGKAVTLRPGPVRSPAGPRSPAHPDHDRFWALAAESGTVVCFHAADAGYGRYAVDWGETSTMSTFAVSAFFETLSLHLEKPIFDTMAAMICHGAFDRHPNLKVAAIELGAGWVPDLLRRLKIAYGRVPQLFGADPVEAFHEHVWVTPFHEQHIPEVLESMRPERVLFGSDWPHPEGVAEPADFAEEVAMLPQDVQRRIMADNMRELLDLR